MKSWMICPNHVLSCNMSVIFHSIISIPGPCHSCHSYDKIPEVIIWMGHIHATSNVKMMPSRHNGHWCFKKWSGCPVPWAEKNWNGLMTWMISGVPLIDGNLHIDGSTCHPSGGFTISKLQSPSHCCLALSKRCCPATRAFPLFASTFSPGKNWLHWISWRWLRTCWFFESHQNTSTWHNMTLYQNDSTRGNGVLTYPCLMAKCQTPPHGLTRLNPCSLKQNK